MENVVDRPDGARTTMPRFGDRLSIAPDLQVSPFCCGLVNDYRMIPAAFDAGINFFFLTADMHWPFYQGVRQGLTDLLSRGGGVRERIVVAVVSYLTQPEFGVAPFWEALISVPGLDRIDVVVSGGTYSADLVGRATRLRGTVRKNSMQLGARAIGASFHDRQAALAAVNHNLVDVAFIRYNPTHPGARTDLFPHLRVDRATPVFNFKSVYGNLERARLTELGVTEDFWQPDPVDYYRYALSLRAVDGILFSPASVAQLEELDRAMQSGPLSDDEQEHLQHIAALDKTDLAKRGISV